MILDSSDNHYIAPNRMHPCKLDRVPETVLFEHVRIKQLNVSPDSIILPPICIDFICIGFAYK